MILKDTTTKQELQAIIEPFVDEDFKTIKNSKDRFNKFNWKKCRGQEVYKIRLKNNDIILGLMCLIEHTDENTNAIEIELLEVK